MGPFYPEGMDAKDFLAHYAKEFDVVEADVTYYRIPDEKLVSGWNERTPDGFVICAKFPRSIVHCGEERLPDKDKVLNLRPTTGGPIRRSRSWRGWTGTSRSYPRTSATPWRCATSGG